MNIRKLAAAAVIGATAWGGAQAETLFTENFDTGNSFSGGTRVNDDADDYLLLSLLSSTASTTLSFAQSLSQLTLSFWYSGPSPTFNGTVTLTKLGSLTSAIDESLGNTPGGVAQYALNNPGPSNGGLGGAFDKYFEYIVPTTLAAGDYTLSFSRAVGPLNSLKLDDVVLTALPVPEPETYALMLGGLGIVAWVARRRRPEHYD